MQKHHLQFIAIPEEHSALSMHSTCTCTAGTNFVAKKQMLLKLKKKYMVRGFTACLVNSTLVRPTWYCEISLKCFHFLLHCGSFSTSRAGLGSLRVCPVTRTATLVGLRLRCVGARIWQLPPQQYDWDRPYRRM